MGIWKSGSVQCEIQPWSRDYEADMAQRFLADMGCVQSATTAFDKIPHPLHATLVKLCLEQCMNHFTDSMPFRGPQLVQHQPGA